MLTSFCNQAEGQLILERKESVRIRDELNQQADNLEAEIRQLENRFSFDQTKLKNYYQ